jgi:hypothetical protein
MQPHTKVYLKHFDYGQHQDVFIPCEVCGSRCKDIHHLDGRIGKDANNIENLIGLCRECHTKAEHSPPFNNYCKAIHKDFLKIHTP